MVCYCRYVEEVGDGKQRRQKDHGCHPGVFSSMSSATTEILSLVSLHFPWRFSFIKKALQTLVICIELIIITMILKIVLLDRKFKGLSNDIIFIFMSLDLN